MQGPKSGVKTLINVGAGNKALSKLEQVQAFEEEASACWDVRAKELIGTPGCSEGPVTFFEGGASSQLEKAA